MSVLFAQYKVNSKVKQTNSMVQQEGNICFKSPMTQEFLHAYLTNDSGTFSVWLTRCKAHFMHCIAAEKMRISPRWVGARLITILE